jgi:hypothetical protein
MISEWKHKEQVPLGHDLFHLAIGIIALFAFGKDFIDDEVSFHQKQGTGKLEIDAYFL